MSKIGKIPIDIPSNVDIKIDNEKIITKGPKGLLTLSFSHGISIELKDNKIFVQNQKNFIKTKNFHGLFRSLINNMIIGVSLGFKKELVLNGVGYSAKIKGNVLTLLLGFSHPVIQIMPDDIKISVDKTGRKILIEGIEKQLVGAIAAQIRIIRPPEPYLGKGVRYLNEIIKRKEGKSSTK